MHALPMLLRRSTVPVLAAALMAITTGCSTFRPNSYNLMKLSRPSSDAVAGTWTVSKRHLESEVVAHARIALRMVPHGDYRFQCKFSRAIGEDAVSMILPVGKRQVGLLLDGRRGDAHYSGLELVDGDHAYENITTDRNFELVNHRIYFVDVTVRTMEDDCIIAVDLDKMPFIRWMGPLSKLSLPSEWALTGNARIGLGSNNGVVQVRSAWLHMIPAEATRIGG